MKLLIPFEELDNYKSRDKLPLECEQCYETFYASKNNVQWAIKRKGYNYLKFCSHKCQNEKYDKKEEFPCHFCGKIKIHKQREIKNNKFLFCSNSCSTKYWNAHKTWGSPRSKLEIWIEKQLGILYPYLNIEYNDRLTINAELDIYIPSLQLAFELNGIFHYEPIYGEEKLCKVQTNDDRKFQACIEQNISLCVIDTHGVKYFKEKNFTTIFKHYYNNH